MFHVKRPIVLALAGIIAFSFLAVGCSRGTQPRGWAAPAKAGNLLMVSTKAGRLDGLDAQTRETRWRFPNNWSLPKGVSSKLTGIYGAPILSQDGSVVFVGDHNGYLYAFRPGDFSAGASTKPKATGVHLDGAIIGGIALDPSTGNLYATAGDKLYRVPSAQLIAATSSSDAKIETLFTTGDQIWGSPVVSGGKVFFSSLDGNLYALDLATGKEVWRFPTGRALPSTPVVAGDLVLTGGFDNRMHAIDIASGSEKWSFTAANWVWSRPAVDGSNAYFGDFDGNIYAVSLSNGEKVWSESLDKGAIRSGPALSGGKLVVATDDGWLIGIDVSSHSTLWSKDVGSDINADLVVADSSVLIAPTGCVTPSGASDKAYYTSVDPSNGDLARAGGVC